MSGSLCAAHSLIQCRIVLALIRQWSRVRDQSVTNPSPENRRPRPVFVAPDRALNPRPQEV